MNNAPDNGNVDQTPVTPETGSPTNETFIPTSSPGSAEYDPRQAPPAAPKFADFIPNDYKEKVWVQNILKSENPDTEIFRQFEEAQTLLGKRQVSQIPAADAPQEQWQAFYEQLGVPKTPDGYQVQPIQWAEQDREMGAFLESKRDPKLMDKMREVALKHGIPVKAFNEAIQEHDKMYLDLYRNNVKAHSDVTVNLDKQYADYMQKMFGPDATSAQTFGNKLLRECVDPIGKTILDEMSQTETGPAMVALLANFANSFYKKYVGEDKLNLELAGTKSIELDASMNEIDGISDKCIKLMSDPDYDNPNSARYKELRTQVTSLYARQKTLMAGGT